MRSVAVPSSIVRNANPIASRSVALPSCITGKATFKPLHCARMLGGRAAEAPRGCMSLGGVCFHVRLEKTRARDVVPVNVLRGPAPHQPLSNLLAVAVLAPPAHKRNLPCKVQFLEAVTLHTCILLRFLWRNLFCFFFQLRLVPVVHVLTPVSGSFSDTIFGVIIYSIGWVRDSIFGVVF